MTASFLVQAIVEYLVNSLWLTPLLAVTTWLVVRTTRPSLVMQHVLWLFTLAAAVALPCHGINGPVQRSSPQVEELAPASTSAPQLLLEQTAPAIPAPPIVAHSRSLELSSTVTCAIALAYVAMVLFGMYRLLAGYVAARRIAASVPPARLTATEFAVLRACARTVGLSFGRLPRTGFFADSSAGPMVIGFRKPALLLPEELRSTSSSFNADRLVAVLLHELAHVRRRDYLVNLVTGAASSPLAYHPCAWIMHHRIRQTREMICDAHAAQAIGSPSSYAQSLLAVANGYVAPARPIEAVGLFHLHRSTLEERIMHLTTPSATVSTPQRIVRLAAVSLAIAATAAAAMSLHLRPTLPVVFAAQTAVPVVVPQTAQAPAATQAPAGSPAPASAAPARSPARAAKPTVSTNEPRRTLTPQEQQDIDRRISQATEQLRQATSELASAQANSADVVNSPEFKHQMELMRQNLAQMKLDMFKDGQRIEVKTAINPEMKIQLDQIHLYLQKPEVQVQLTQARAYADPSYRLQIETARQQLHQQINEHRNDPDAIQRDVDEFVHKLDAMAPPAVPAPPIAPSVAPAPPAPRP